MDEDVPTSAHFDSTEAIASGEYPELGKKLTIFVSKPEHYDAVVMKSDAATLILPDFELEEAPGIARYISIEDLVIETKDKIESSLGYFPPGPHRDKITSFLNLLSESVSKRKHLTLILDDPIGLSYVKKDSAQGMKIEEEEYVRTWDQNEELGLLEEFEIEKTDSIEEALEQLADLIKKSNKIVGLTGAGISVESGVPAFRGGDSKLWEKYGEAARDISHFLASEEIQEMHWKMKTEFHDIASKASPNASHDIFAYLHQQNKLELLITQNIDSLHERSGLPSEKILSVHGSESVVYCVQCKKPYDREETHNRVKSGEKIPRCECGDVLRFGTVYFGEPLDGDLVRQCQEALNKADLLIVMGTSLVVQPVNRFPRVCFINKTPVVILNLEETDLDPFATLVLNGKSGELSAQLLQLLKGDS